MENEKAIECQEIKNSYKSEIDLYNFDTQVYLIEKDIQDFNQVKLTGRGGTAFIPVIELINKSEYDLSIILTDGQSYDKKPCNNETLWLIYDNKSFKFFDAEIIHIQ